MTEILDLWPTKLIRAKLDGFEEPNRELLKLARDWDKEKKDLTTDYRDNNPFNVDTPATNWLRGRVNGTVIEYLKAIGIDFPMDWQIHGWVNINRTGDYHDPHNHPHCYLSGTYYVKVPQAASKRRQRADVRPNHITFYDPRFGINMSSIRNDPVPGPGIHRAAGTGPIDDVAGEPDAFRTPEPERRDPRFHQLQHRPQMGGPLPAEPVTPSVQAVDVHGQDAVGVAFVHAGTFHAIGRRTQGHEQRQEMFIRWMVLGAEGRDFPVVQEIVDAPVPDRRRDPCRRIPAPSRAPPHRKRSVP